MESRVIMQKSTIQISSRSFAFSQIDEKKKKTNQELYILIIRNEFWDSYRNM